MYATIAAAPRKRAEMTQGVKLRRAGGSIAATLPKEMAHRLKLTAGDTVIAIETERGILLTPYDPDTEEALSIAERSRTHLSQRATRAGKVGIHAEAGAPADIPAGSGCHPDRHAVDPRWHAGAS